MSGLRTIDEMLPPLFIEQGPILKKLYTDPDQALSDAFHARQLGLDFRLDCYHTAQINGERDAEARLCVFSQIQSDCGSLVPRHKETTDDTK